LIFWLIYLFNKNKVIWKHMCVKFCARPEETYLLLVLYFFLSQMSLVKRCSVQLRISRETWKDRRRTEQAMATMTTPSYVSLL